MDTIINITDIDLLAGTIERIIVWAIILITLLIEGIKFLLFQLNR